MWCRNNCIIEPKVAGVRCFALPEASEDDPRFPKWLGDIDRFMAFHEQYVADIEHAREVEANAELIAQCEEQVVLLEELLIEKQAILEEHNLKKKKGKKGKK